MDDALLQRAGAARARIREGGLRGAALRDLLASVPAGDREAFVDVMLGLDGAPADDVALPRGAVPYLPAAVDAVLALASSLPAGLFVDLGSGLGRVVLLVHLLTGAVARGVEIQPRLVAAARTAAAALGLRDVTFVAANAADGPVEGDVFFLYAPFNGPMLRDVLARIEDLARRRAVVVATLDLDLEGFSWLVRRPTPAPPLAVYDARARASA